jgi:hypothetical protein
LQRDHRGLPVTSASAQADLPWRDAYAARKRAGAMLDVVREAIRRRGTAREVAAELDQIFGPEGRPVSESVLKAALSPESERNYFRLEWIVVVLDDPAVKAFLATPMLTPEEELRATRAWLAAAAPGLLPNLDRALGRST